MLIMNRKGRIGLKKIEEKPPESIKMSFMFEQRVDFQTMRSQLCLVDRK